MNNIEISNYYFLIPCVCFTVDRETKNISILSIINEIVHLYKENFEKCKAWVPKVVPIQGYLIVKLRVSGIREGGLRGK